MAHWKGQLLLEGRAEEWQSLASALAPGHTLALDTAGDPKPYSRFLSSLVTRGSNSKVKLVVERDDTLVITGSESSLFALGKTMLIISETPDPYDIHVDYYPDHAYLDEQSVPAVFEVIL